MKKPFPNLGPTASIFVHELRQPLSIIQIATWNIKKKSRDGTLDNNIQSIERMIEQCDYILKNFLNFTHIKMPEFKKAPIKKLVQEAIAQSKAQFNGTRVKVVAELKSINRETIETDPHQFKDVLVNIITNAFEALSGNKKGKIHVRAQRDKKFLTLKISDNGRGISPAHLKRIGTPFFTLKPEGSGLGLAISQEIVNLHGGHMHINSRLAKGTNVSIRLPYRRERQKVE